ncbi:MAG: molecular chaperone TorD family protein, partial [Campylobacterales bacterium]|nr:molecular chaperone TorD family protein [Campylobacterales bacterium]
MEKMQRAFIYAMLSNIFSDSLNEKEINDFKNNEELLSVIGEASKEYFNSKSVEEIKEELNVDFTTTFLINAHPIESAVTDLKQDVLVGLQNPVMQFYYKYGYDINLLNTEIQVPDHLAIELGFMQNLV